MKRTISILVLLSIILFLLMICTNGPIQSVFHKKSGTLQLAPNDQDRIHITSGDNDAAKKRPGLCAWTVYWDCKNVDSEVKILGNQLTEIVYFAAGFDKNNRLIIPKETTRTFQALKNEPNARKYTNYRCIVNDQIKSDGTSSLKSTALLYELFSSEEVLNHHIDDIINITLEGGYDGVEIDYEAIKNDTTLWNMFLNFSTKLYQKLKEHNLKMRIDLESSAPIGKLKFAEGPEYVMMCYNLYGVNSKPGPKADKKFIRDLSAKMSCLPGNKSLAFATGGFDWDETGKAHALTEQEANTLIKKYSITPVRDESSSALTFKYSDQNGSKHEVWFADGSTLISWINSMDNKGNYGVSFWRLNGNNNESLELLSK